MQFFDPLKDCYETVLKVKHGTNIYRDSFGVPHIFSNDEEDLAFAAGYAVAQDRLFQMDLFRWRATGRLAEFLNDDFPQPKTNYEEADKIVRRNGYTSSELTFRTPFKMLYRNFWMGLTGISKRCWPIREYCLLNTASIGWAPNHGMRILGMMGLLFGSAGENELMNVDLIQTLAKKYGRAQAEKMFQDSLWQRSCLSNNCSPRGRNFPLPKKTG
jgi:penicillin G amidase